MQDFINETIYKLSQIFLVIDKFLVQVINKPIAWIIRKIYGLRKPKPVSKINFKVLLIKR